MYNLLDNVNNLFMYRGEYSSKSKGVYIMEIHVFEIYYKFNWDPKDSNYMIRLVDEVLDNFNKLYNQMDNSKSYRNWDDRPLCWTTDFKHKSGVNCGIQNL